MEIRDSYVFVGLDVMVANMDELRLIIGIDGFYESMKRWMFIWTIIRPIGGTNGIVQV